MTVTVVVVGAEAMPALFVAVIVKVTTVGVNCIAGNIGARKVMVAPVPGGFGPGVTVSTAKVPAGA